MRLVITGKTRSGKSTALHRILSHLLRCKWDTALLLDGKGSELHSYLGVAGVTYLGPDQVESWATQLQRLADALPTRYTDLAARGLRQAAADDPRNLVVADEVQRGTRDRVHGRQVKEALTLIAEQSAALGDVLVLAAQRPEHSIPPNVRINASVHLRMLGVGYFHLQADGHPTRSGRVAYVEPHEAIQEITSGAPALPPTPDRLPEVLGSRPVPPGRAPATLYVGSRGSGKTHALTHYPNGKYRHIYVNLIYPHRQTLLDVIEQAGAVAPARASIPDLADIAALALAAEPTLLLLDNLDHASEKTRTSILRLMDASAEVALAALTPETPAQERKLQPFVPRCDVKRLQPLKRDQARALAEQHLPNKLADRETTVRRIVDLSDGHPATIVSLARRARRGTLAELRGFDVPRPKIGLAWLIVVPILALLIVSRWHQDSYWLSLGLLAISILMRPLFYRSIRSLR